MFSLNFTPIPFHRWMLENSEWIESQYRAEFGALLDKNTRCSYCDGQGYAECDLGHSHDCEECDGEGEFTKTPEDVLEEYGGKLYRAEIKKDHEKVSKFLKEREEESGHAS